MLFIVLGILVLVVAIATRSIPSVSGFSRTGIMLASVLFYWELLLAALCK